MFITVFLQSFFGSGYNCSSNQLSVKRWSILTIVSKVITWVNIFHMTIPITFSFLVMVEGLLELIIQAPKGFLA